MSEENKSLFKRQNPQFVAIMVSRRKKENIVKSKTWVEKSAPDRHAPVCWGVVAVEDAER